MSQSISVYLANECVFDTDVTYNLAKMARHVGLSCLFEDCSIKGRKLLPLIDEAIVLMIEDEYGCRQFSPKGNWGSYEGFLVLLVKLQVACRKRKTRFRSM